MTQFWVSAQPFVVGVVLFLLALIIRRIIFWILHNWRKESTSDIGDVIIRVTRGASLLWCILLGGYLGVRIAASPTVEASANKILLGIAVLSALMVVANIAAAIIRSYATRTKMALPISGLTQTVTKTLIIGVGILLILDSLHVPIGSLLATLGIGSLALALALQTTLSNIFSGAFIIMGGYIRPGDYIKLDSGEEGYVADISWGTTRIRTLSNSTVVIPNSKLAGGVVTNHSHQKNPPVKITVDVSYASDPEVVEKLLVEEAQGAVGKVPGLLGEPAPVARFAPGFGADSLGFTLTCFVNDFSDRGLVEHELRNRIFKRFRAQKIQMPK